jgi:hypothetical protein
MRDLFDFLYNLFLFRYIYICHSYIDNMYFDGLSHNTIYIYIYK